MKLASSAQFDASAARLWDVLTDPAYAVDKASRMSVAAHDASVTAVGDTTLVRVTMTLSTDEFPDIAKRFVGPVLTLVDERRWHRLDDRGSRADLRVSIQGAPMTMAGTVTLTPAGDQSRVSIDADLTAKVPLVARTIEAAAAPAILAGFDAEADLLREWLARAH